MLFSKCFGFWISELNFSQWHIAKFFAICNTNWGFLKIKSWSHSTIWNTLSVKTITENITTVKLCWVRALTMVNHLKTKNRHNSAQSCLCSMIPKPKCSEFHSDWLPEVKKDDSCISDEFIFIFIFPIFIFVPNMLFPPSKFFAMF